MKLFGKKKSGKDWFEEGKDFYKNEQFLDAIECFDKVILDKKMHKKNTAKALSNKGKCMAKLEDYETAIKCLDFAIQLDSKSSDLWFEKSNILRKMNQDDEADKCIEKAKELDK
ncbi:MAG: tetratricopeptide repeat protein [Nitrosopumilus sp.]|jgi:tetratricopeptide (TPR) repeat protein